MEKKSTDLAIQQELSRKFEDKIKGLKDDIIEEYQSLQDFDTSTENSYRDEDSKRDGSGKASRIRQNTKV